MLLDKPMADILRERHNAEAKRRGLQGRTARRKYDMCTPVTTCVRSGEPHVFDRRYASPYMLTQFELEGHDVSRSLDRDGRWDCALQALAENALSPPLVRATVDGMQETTLCLMPLAMVLPDADAQSRWHEEMTNLYRVTGSMRPFRSRKKSTWRGSVRGLQHVTKLQLQPPEAAGHNSRLLPMRLHCAKCKVCQTAVVRQNSSHSAFSVAEAAGKPLDIDLGASSLVTAFSTQGRHPPTRRFPHVAHDPQVGHVVEGQPEWDGRVKYKGPYFTVLLTEADRAGVNHPHLQPQWVARYELLWRAEGGREWHSLGTFRGNDDATSEIAHALSRTDAASKELGGVVCRHLRVVPLECKGGGALRVGVYGLAHPPRAARPAGKQPRTQRAATDGGSYTSCDGSETETHLVRYTITSPSQAHNPRFCKDGSGLKGCRCPYCLGTDMRRHRGSSARLRRRLAAVHEAELLWSAQDHQ